MQYLLLVVFTLVFFTSSIAQYGISPEWSERVVLPNPNGDKTIRGFLYGNIAVFSSGKRVVFLNKTDPVSGIYYTSSNDGIKPIFFAPVNVIGLNFPKITTDNSDNLHIIWASQSPKALYYTQMDTSLSFVIDSVRITSNPNFNSYNGMYLISDLKNRVHVMWHERNYKID